MLISLNSGCTFYPHHIAEQMAADMAIEDDEWTYTVIYASETGAYINIYDEEGEFVARH